MPGLEGLSSRLEYPIDIGKRYDVGLDSTSDGDVLLMRVDPQHNAGGGIILALHHTLCV